MPKILLVEDDNNLREIFQMRLEAEGYKTVVAADGEEGLVVAMKERPDLVIADVMMPKLSGFEMVENLRSAPEMKDVKVIMMTALGQAEDQARGEKLGVVKYLVKSQVTLEDFAGVVKDVLGPGNPADVAAPQQVESSSIKVKESESPMQDDNTQNNPAPAGDSPAPADPAAPAANPMADGQQSADQEQQAVDNQVSDAMGGSSDSSAAPAGDSGSTDIGAPAMPPATDEPAESGGDDKPASPPTDPTSNAL